MVKRHRLGILRSFNSENWFLGSGDYFHSRKIIFEYCNTKQNVTGFFSEVWENFVIFYVKRVKRASFLSQTVKRFNFDLNNEWKDRRLIVFFFLFLWKSRCHFEGRDAHWLPPNGPKCKCFFSHTKLRPRLSRFINAKELNKD